LRNREAARYARWSAIAAGLIALGVAGVYAQREFRQGRARRGAPAAVPTSVQQQSAQFSFSKVEEDHTLFTVRASHATQYKDQNRALLEDVWITVYGRDGSRNDNIHTRECSYEPLTGAVRCEGEVQIEIQNANPSAAKSSGALASSLEVKTSDLTFNRNTGEASTPAPVEFHFPAGQGHGLGVSYSTRDSVVRVEHEIEFELAASAQTGGLPASASGSSLEIHRTEHTVVLKGPALVRQGGRELSADTISVELDAAYHVQRAVAEGHPQIRATEGGGKAVVSASRFEGVLNAEGWVERVIADGGVTGTRQTAAGTDRFSAARAAFAMLPQHNLIKDMTATGGVSADSQQGGDSHRLKTDALRVTFSATAQPGQSADKQHIESAETLAPATIESATSTDFTTLRAKKFVAQLGPTGRLDKLFGHGSVEVSRQVQKGAPQVISAAELAATFGARGQWETLDESGDVRFQQADRQATAARASIVRATDVITLDGSPVISDATSRTTASRVVMNQKSGEVTAAGGVVSTYVPTAQGDAVGLGSGAAHISADALSGSVNSGHVTYAGHARLWQGDSVLDSDQIELWRDDKKLQAAGHVVAVFSQLTGQFVPAPETSPAAGPKPPRQTLWKVRAPALTYWSNQGRAHLEGGVSASSDQGSLESRTLNVFLESPTSTPVTEGATPPNPPPTTPGGGQLKRVLAQGGVVVRQGDRRGMAEQAEYTAATGKFVLSGGQPTLVNAASDTTTGHSLTFFVANDTILIDSQEGSRTLTKHRVEK
jgi:lipopolysaccharide export system protein LptA